MDISLLNVDKNNKTIRTNHKIIENQYMKKTKTCQTKTFTVTIFQENHFLITIVLQDNNQPTDITTAENLQTKKLMKFLTKKI